MEKRTIFLIRHCQTELSSAKRLIGQYDVALSAEGLARSREIGEAVMDYGVEHLFCSTLKRTTHMAEIIASYLKIRPEPMKELNEINLGSWDGLHVEDIKRNYPNEYDARGKDLLNYRIPGGENFFDLQKRVKNAFGYILKKCGNIMIIGHKSVNRVILCHVMGIDINDLFSIPQDYGCCNIIIQENMELKVRDINWRI
jgi:broad specificity phosphatase PhoE